jgi:hypothetical protein
MRRRVVLDIKAPDGWEITGYRNVYEGNYYLDAFGNASKACFFMEGPRLILRRVPQRVPAEIRHFQENPSRKIWCSQDGTIWRGFPRLDCITIVNGLVGFYAGGCKTLWKHCETEENQ